MARRTSGRSSWRRRCMTRCTRGARTRPARLDALLRTSRPRAGQLAAAGRLISYKSDSYDTLIWGHPKAEEGPMGNVVMYSSVSVDGFIAGENDQPGPLF